MRTQRILLGDCLDVLSDQRDVRAFVLDPPGLVGYGGFMGRKWDTAHEKSGKFVPMLPTRGKQHASELEKDHDFTLYWAVRFSMAYDIAAKDAVIVLWTLPRTSHLMANALRAAGWTIKENLIHLFGTGWMKANRTTEDGERVPNAFAPGYENWILAIKGKPDLDIDACRVPRGAGDVSWKENSHSQNQHAGWKRPWNDDPNAVEAANERSRESQAKTQALGSLPKNALLSHCEECVRVGSKKAKATSIHGESSAVRGDNSTHGQAGGHLAPGRTQRISGFASEDGTESVPAWHCLAGCVCGARSKWDPEKPLPRCPCGEVWRWLCAVAEVNAQSGESVATIGKKNKRNGSGCSAGLRPQDHDTGFADQGGASRFFNTFSYLSKCSSSERHAGCENLFWKANKKNPFGFDQVTKEEWEGLPSYQGNGKDMRESPAHRRHDSKDIGTRAQGNVHPTVKSYRLMHWLHSLTGAKRIGDLCGGSGTGMFTAYLDVVDWIGAEMCPEAIVIAEARLAFWSSLSHEAVAAFMDQKPMTAVMKAQAKSMSVASA